MVDPMQFAGEIHKQWPKTRAQHTKGDYLTRTRNYEFIKFNIRSQQFMNLDMCFLVDAADVIICCTISLGQGSPSILRI